MLCGVCISPHSISVCNTAAKTLLPEWGRKGYNNSVVRIFRCMGGRVTHIGPQALATPGIRRNISVPLGSYNYPVRAKLTSPFFTFWARSLSCLSHGAGRRPNIVYCRATVRTSQVWERFLYLYFKVCERSVSHFGTAYLVPFIKEANSSWEIPYMLLR